MLILLIGIVWLLVVAFFVALCRASAQGDAAMMGPTKPTSRPRVTAAGLTLWEDPHPGEVRLRRRALTGPGTDRARSSRRRERHYAGRA